MMRNVLDGINWVVTDEDNNNQELKSESSSRDDKIKLAESLMNFLREFNIPLSIRLFNTLTVIDEPTPYLISYARLTGRDYEELAEKTNSYEYKVIEAALKNTEASKVINKRFKIFYGPQGSGKTYTAMQETTLPPLVMNENITPNELFQDFTFEDGKPVFKGSIARKAMEDGKLLILDEFNLTSPATMNYLQGFIDGKDVVTIGQDTVKIKEGFGIIATMNDIILGYENHLPEPIVDRASELIHFEPSPENLVDYAL